jgi:hypothetical protein
MLSASPLMNGADDCIGAFQPTGECSIKCHSVTAVSGLQQATFKITKMPLSGGKPCARADGDTKSITCTAPNECSASSRRSAATLSNKPFFPIAIGVGFLLIIGALVCLIRRANRSVDASAVSKPRCESALRRRVSVSRRASISLHTLPASHPGEIKTRRLTAYSKKRRNSEVTRENNVNRDIDAAVKARKDGRKKRKGEKQKAEERGASSSRSGSRSRSRSRSDASDRFNRGQIFSV